LAGFEPALGFIDHVNSTFTAHNTAVAVTLLKRAERIFDLHGPSPSFAARLCAFWFAQKGRFIPGGRYWDRTSDPYDVNVVLYR
tara:strand:+ start:931 stop:1182 length:252 start_codon:yes stop_codon:yes gene_type:complete